MKFKEKLKMDMIPAVERMIVKEKNHILKLKERKKYIKKYSFFYFRSDSLIDEINEMIKNSEKYLNHYELRLIDYKNYVNENN
jgi:hypothetical protein